MRDWFYLNPFPLRLEYTTQNWPRNHGLIGNEHEWTMVKSYIGPWDEGWWGCCWMGWLLTASFTKWLLATRIPVVTRCCGMRLHLSGRRHRTSSNDGWKLSSCGGSNGATVWLTSNASFSCYLVGLWKNGTLKSFKIQCFFYNISPAKTVILSHTPFLKIHSMCSQIWTLWVLHFQKTPWQRSPAWGIL